MKLIEPYRWVIVLLIFFGCTPLIAQLNFIPYKLDSKLAYNYTSQLKFDQNNFLWIATHRGLYKSDGYKAKYYVFNPNDSLSLKNNIVYKMYLDWDGDFWVLTDKGVQLYDQEKETFHTHLGDYVDAQDEFYKIGFMSAIQVDSSHLFFGTKAGGILYNKHTRDYKYFPVIENNAHDGYSSLAHVVDIVSDEQDKNIFYLLTKAGIIVYNVREQKFSKITAIENIPFSRITVPGLKLINHQNTLYFIIKNGIYNYDIRTKQVDSLIMFNETNYRPMQLRDFIFENDTTLLISSADYGIYKFNVENRTKPLLVENGAYNKLAKDNHGYLWTVEQTRYLVRTAEPVFSESRTAEFVSINNLWVNDVAVPMRDLLKQEIFELKDFQREIIVEASLKNPVSQAVVDYHAQLDGGDWKEVEEGRKVHFENLSPGIHELQFKAIFNSNAYFSNTWRFKIDKYFYETWWFRLLVLSTIFFFSLSIYYLFMSRKRERELHQRRVLGMELDALRSQMNPHFLFNTLNSIKNYVLTKTPDEAANYLTKFSVLIRSILENSKSSFLTLEQELKSLRLYIEMEHLRFGKDFNYDISIDEKIDISTFKIAPMLIQPFVENAIWHGLMNKMEDRELSLSFEQIEKAVICRIRDNGIGLEASKQLYQSRPRDKKSLGMKITKERIESINLLYGIVSKVQINDLKPSGTEVIIRLPEIKN